MSSTESSILAFNQQGRPWLDGGRDVGGSSAQRGVGRGGEPLQHGAGRPGPRRLQMKLPTACKWNCALVLTLGLLTVLLPTASAIQWLAVSQMSSLASVPHHTGICKGLKGTLVPKQVQFCRENPFFMEAVKLGALEAINECQFQFRTQRWNCSALSAGNGNPYFSLPQIPRKDGMQSDGFSRGNEKVDGTFYSQYNHVNNNIDESSKKRKRQSPMTARLKSSPIDPYGKINKNHYGNPHVNQPDYDKINNFNKFSYNVRREEHFYGSGLSRASDPSGDTLEGAVDHRYNDAADPAPPEHLSNTSADPIANVIVSSTSEAPVLLVTNTTTKSNVTDRPDVRPNGQNRGDQRKNGRRRRKRPRRRGKDARRSSNRRGKKAPSSLVPFPFPVVPRGTRESAFVHAISSAGVAHAITLRCSSGALEDCGCDHSVKGQTAEGFQWSGCSHNIAYGVSLSKRFVDASDKKKVQRAQQAMRRQPRSAGKLRRASRALINLHNNEAGRQLLQQDMRVGCKCHGVSGSCELKTCWRQMPAFREVGELLKEKFDSATEVKLKKVGGRLKLIPNKQLFKSLREDDLVFVASSPEYCDFDPSGGSLGTHGRACNKSSGGVDSCDRLCCDRGYTSSQQMVHERCNCKFHWCCYVECRTCLKEVTVHTCN